MFEFQYMFTRKHAGQEYKFFLMVPFREEDKKDPGKYSVQVETPPNGFGYPDIVLLSSDEKHAGTMWRYLPPYILRALEKQMRRLLDDARRGLCA